MKFQDAVRFIFGFTNYEFTPLSAATAAALDLERLRALLDRLGNPQKGRRSVHLTGSKGKGSTGRMLAALLSQGGARTGLYTSPHLHSPRERIMIDGEPISEAELTRLVTELQPHVETENRQRPGAELTTFELLTALGFLAFREHACDWQVVEVGLGGRLDATNVLDDKALCIFTPISLEHTAILGSTTAAIAGDKAGILRAGCRTVLAPQDAEAERVLREACAALGVPVASTAAMCTWQSDGLSLDGQQCEVKTPRGYYRFTLPLLGRYQVENAATAILGMENLISEGIELDPAQVAEALAGVRWPGRLELLSRAPLVFVDGAHNAASAARLAEALVDLCCDRLLWLVVGTLADKDLAGIVAALAPLAQGVIAVQPAHPRARPASEIVRAFQEAGVPAREAKSVSQAVETAKRKAGADGAVCATGSLYVVAEARAHLLGLQP
ncbi:MAG: bifunctional folylpolyglutamate synthase/dihydrofolate synthase [Dehalococcoidia bacterium]